MTSVELKIPPPAWMLIFAFGMWAVHRAVPGLALPIPIAPALALGFVSMGALFAGRAIWQFLRANTTVHPHKPQNTAQLVTDGIYRISRNPMYVGLLLVLTGWAIYLANLLALLCLPLFVFAITRVQIVPEERILRDKFGDAYVDYCGRVRRWI